MKMKITIPSRIANGFWDFGCLRVIVPKFSHFNNSMEETSAEDLELKKKFNEVYLPEDIVKMSSRVH